MKQETMSQHQIDYIQAKVKDIWYVLDREQNDEKIARLCGKLAGIRMMLEMFGYTVTLTETGDHKVVKEEEA